jgi:hypothetical protein
MARALGTDTLTDAVQKVESIRDVKDVQRHYAHMLQIGDVAEALALLDEDAVLRWGGERRSGRAAISAWLDGNLRRWGGARPGSLFTEIIDQPLVNLSEDGNAAMGRWHCIRFLGDGKGGARIEAGIYENGYVLSGGGWKIGTIDYTPLYEGDYAEGWTNSQSSGVPIVPRHFTADEAGAPVGKVASVTSFGSDDPGTLAARIARLNDEDDIRNLQHALGYYVDRRMWTDVVDLFEDGAVVWVVAVCWMAPVRLLASPGSCPGGFRAGLVLVRPRRMNWRTVDCTTWNVACRAPEPTTVWRTSRPPTATTWTISNGRRWPVSSRRVVTSRARSPATTSAPSASSRRRSPLTARRSRPMPGANELFSTGARRASSWCRTTGAPRTCALASCRPERPVASSRSGQGCTAAATRTTRRCSRTVCGGCGASPADGTEPA